MPILKRKKTLLKQPLRRNNQSGKSPNGKRNLERRQEENKSKKPNKSQNLDQSLEQEAMLLQVLTYVNLTDLKLIHNATHNLSKRYL